MRSSGSARNEAGVTLAELLITVVIIGIIMTALLGALLAGLRFGPETSARIGNSVDVTFLTDRLSDDIANAAGPVTLADETTTYAVLEYSNECSGSFKAGLSGPWTVGPVDEVIALVETATITQLDGTAVVYRVVLRAHDTAVNEVVVLRHDGAWSTVLSGYCAPGANPVTSTVTDGGFRLTISAASTPESSASTVEIGGDRRTV